MEDNRKIPYATWTVDGTEYKLKLTTATITKLEEQFKTNLLNLVASGNIPALLIMLKITHAAMQKYHHGIKERDVQDLFDQYLEEGGSQTAFMADVFMPIYQASGFFSAEMAETMTDKLDEAKNLM